MKKYILIASTTIIILVIFFALGPFFTALLSDPENSGNNLIGNQLSIEQAGQLSIKQGTSDHFITVTNESENPLSFKLDLTHAGLSLIPREDTLFPGASRDIILQVDDLFPAGKMNTLVYLLAEADGKNLGMEAFDLLLNVNPGELKLEERDGEIIVLWNDATAIPGTTVYFRSPEFERELWLIWDTVPLFKAAPYLYTGTHSLQFMARLGEERSPSEIFDIMIEGKAKPEEPPLTEDIFFKYVTYKFGIEVAEIEITEILEYMGYSEDMDQIDLRSLLRQIDSEAHEEYIELLEYTDVMDVIAYLDFLIELNEPNER